LSLAASEEWLALLSQTSKIARSELFAHTVQENILTHDVDYFTLGWTRLLHVALDLIPSEQIDELVPRYVLHCHSYDRSLSRDLVETFLFPDIKTKDPDGGDTIKPYCIHSETRGALFDIILKLANTDNKRNLIAVYISGLLENGISLGTHG
jgi:hypothetical protein